MLQDRKPCVPIIGADNYIMKVGMLQERQPCLPLIGADNYITKVSMLLFKRENYGRL